MTVSARLALVLCMLASASCATLTFAPPDRDAAAEVGAADAGTTDAGTTDVGTPDVGTPDVGCTADTNSDRMNCGACGRVCATPRGTTQNTCVMGACVPVCAAQFGDCDGDTANGCEAELNTDDRCGSCVAVCLSTQACRPPPPPDTGGALRCVMCGRRNNACCGTPGAECESGLRCDGMTCVM